MLCCVGCTILHDPGSSMQVPLMTLHIQVQFTHGQTLDTISRGHCHVRPPAYAYLEAGGCPRPCMPHGRPAPVADGLLHAAPSSSSLLSPHSMQLLLSPTGTATAMALLRLPSVLLRDTAVPPTVSNDGERPAAAPCVVVLCGAACWLVLWLGVAPAGATKANEAVSSCCVTQSTPEGSSSCLGRPPLPATCKSTSGTWAHVMTEVWQTKHCHV